MKTAAVVALSSAIAVVCHAANPAPLPESLAACAKLSDPMERVHCYDAQMTALSPPAATPAPPALPVPPVAASTATSPPVVSPAATKKFGEEQLPSKARPAASPKEEALMSNITQMRTVGHNMYLISLANGQVWRQEGSQLPALFKVGSDVRIERGAFGSYHLSIAAFGDKNWVLVTRTQ